MKQKFLAGAAATLAVPAVALFAAGPALAAGSGSVQVSNTETVQAYLDPTGKLDVARVYEQVAMQGKGRVELRNPVEVRGLRNLDGFGGFDVQQGQMVGSYDVDGERRVRTVSDYTKKLPLEVTVTYLLDGKTVTPGDVVGKSGRLEVRYTVRNVTGTPAQVSFDDGTGATSTATEDVVIPMVGSLSTTLPATFTDVASGEANIAGDGRGGTKLSFTMTLFGPIGAPEASFGYSAMITDGVVPKASISALPVSPLDSPSFKGGAESYKGGADTGVTLTAGATEIDANLLKLRDGAATLLAGLIQLRDGAKQLDAGLGAQIVPGSRELASGAGDLKAGTSKLRAGASDAKNGAAKLDAGAGQLADGLKEAGQKAPALIGGLKQVADGLDQLDAGLVQLYGGIGTLPDQVKPLQEGIAALRAGIGAKDQVGTLIDGVDQIRSGLAAATKAGADLDKLKGGVDKIQSGTADALSVGGGMDRLQGGVNMAKAADCIAACPVILDQVLAGLAELRTELTDANGGLLQVSGGLGMLKDSLSKAAAGLARVQCGLSNQTLKGVCDPKEPGLLEGLEALDGGVTLLVNGVVESVQKGVGGPKDTAKDETLRGGVHSLQGGIDQIGEGGLALLDGLGQLSAGASELKDGTGKLSSGLGTLANGTGELDAGAGKLRDGASQLADGLGTAADGASKIADGLDEAADGAPALKDGAQQLSDEGTSKLVEAGKGTAADYGQKYALITAGAERAKTEGMAYGAPEGAEGFTAYSLEIAGVDGEGSRNVARTAGALGVFTLGGGLLWWRRGIF